MGVPDIKHDVYKSGCQSCLCAGEGGERGGRSLTYVSERNCC